MTILSCGACGQECKGWKGIAAHIQHSHKDIGREEYYKCFIDPTAGSCGLCGSPTQLKSLSTGFHQFCSVRCAHNSSEVRNRIKKTMRERYGVESYTSTEEFKKKSAKTKEIRHGDPSFNNREKFRETMLERTGRPHNWSGPLGAWSCDQTKLQKYGSMSYANHEQGRKTKMERYGDPHFNREACRATNRERYGVEYPLQNPEILAKNHASGRAHKAHTLPSGRVVHLQGYEPQAMDWLLAQGYPEEGVLSDKRDVPRIRYQDGDRTRYYFPDFYVPVEDLVVEVKSPYTLDQGRENLKLKIQAALEMGLMARVLVVDVQGTEVSVKDLEIEEFLDERAA